MLSAFIIYCTIFLAFFAVTLAINYHDITVTVTYRDILNYFVLEYCKHKKLDAMLLILWMIVTLKWFSKKPFSIFQLNPAVLVISDKHFTWIFQTLDSYCSPYHLWKEFPRFIPLVSFLFFYFYSLHKFKPGPSGDDYYYYKHIQSGIDPNENSVLWNAMIYPLLNTTIYGAIWYQGESNAVYRPDMYNCTFPAMINGWRKEWFSGTYRATNLSFPFGFVQVRNCISAAEQCFQQLMEFFINSLF